MEIDIDGMCSYLPVTRKLAATVVRGDLSRILI